MPLKIIETKLGPDGQVSEIVFDLTGADSMDCLIAIREAQRQIRGPHQVAFEASSPSSLTSKGLTRIFGPYPLTDG